MAGQPIIYANPAFTTLTGYTDDDIIGQNADFFYDAEAAPAAIEAVRKALAAREAIEIQVPARHQNGRRIYLDLRAGPVAGREGQVTHFILVQDDVTKRVEAETQRAELENQLRHSQKIEALGTLAGGIAHDINNTLVPIVALSKVALKTMASDSPQREPMQTILDASYRARDLVAGILAFSRKDMPKTDHVCLQDTVAQAVRLLTATLTPSIAIVQTFADEPLGVSGDENQLVQVLMNLCTNAAHAIGTNPGRITIALDSMDISDSAGAHPSGLPHGRYARVDVTDTGCGMDARTRQRIFEPFYTTKGIGEGTGLGLSVVHGIVANHRGRITVDSELGRGSTFTILLPLAAPGIADDTAEPREFTHA
jgi:PAS domain S-box-containing protein